MKLPTLATVWFPLSRVSYNRFKTSQSLNESALQFEGSKLAPKKIGQALQVGTIVTGEIQTSGNKVQVNIRVIDANTEALGWGSTFMKSRDEFLDLQNEIATSLASEIKGGLETEETKQFARKATQNPKPRQLIRLGDGNGISAVKKALKMRSSSSKKQLSWMKITPIHM